MPRCPCGHPQWSCRTHHLTLLHLLPSVLPFIQTCSLGECNNQRSILKTSVCNCSLDAFFFFFNRSYFCSFIYIYIQLNHANNMTARCRKDLNKHPVLEISKSILVSTYSSSFQISERGWSNMVQCRRTLILLFCLNAVSTLALVLHTIP